MIVPALCFIKHRFAGKDATRSLAALLSDLWRYGLCSALALALDWGLLLVLVHAGMNYLSAAAMSFCAGMVLTYLGSIFFVYRGRRAYPFLAEATGFFLIGFAGLFVNVVLLFGFVKLCGLSVGVAKAPTAAGVFLFNFLSRRMLLFVSRPGMTNLADLAPRSDIVVDLE